MVERSVSEFSIFCLQNDERLQKLSMCMQICGSGAVSSNGRSLNEHMTGSWILSGLLWSEMTMDLRLVYVIRVASTSVDDYADLSPGFALFSHC